MPYRAPCQVAAMLMVVVAVHATGHAAEGPPTSQPTLTREQVTVRLNEDAQAFAAAMPTGLDLASRRAAGRKALPAIRDALSLIDSVPPNAHGDSMDAMKTTYEPWIIVLDDAAFTAKVTAQAKGTGVAALNARLCLALADEILAGRDVAKAEAAAHCILDLAAGAPSSDRAAAALLWVREDERISAETKDAVARALERSTSNVAGAIRFATKWTAEHLAR